MIWLDGMSIAGPAVRLKSFCLIHSLSDLQVGQSTTRSWVAFRRPQYEAFKKEIWGLLILRDSQHAEGIRRYSEQQCWKNVSLLASCYVCRQVESMSQQAILPLSDMADLHVSEFPAGKGAKQTSVFSSQCGIKAELAQRSAGEVALQTNCSRTRADPHWNKGPAHSAVAWCTHFIHRPWLRS